MNARLRLAGSFWTCLAAAMIAASPGFAMESPEPSPSPQGASLLERQADLLMSRGEYDAARELYRSSLKRDATRDALWAKYDRASEMLLLRPGGRPRSTPLPHAEDPLPDPSAEPIPDGTEPTPSPEAPPDLPSDAVPLSTPEPEPTPTPPPADVPYRSPDEIVTLDRPVRTGDTAGLTAPTVNGVPIAIRTPIYEIGEFEFSMDAKGTLHLKGKITNLGSRNFRNPQVYIGLYDKGGTPIYGIKPVRPKTYGTPLFSGSSAPFDAEFPVFQSTVGGFRAYMINP